MPSSHLSSASILLNCPDQKGLISSIVDFFSERNISLKRSEVYNIHDRIFLRCEWMLNACWEDEQEFENEFTPLVDKLRAAYSVRFLNRPQSVGLFVSSQEHVLIEILAKADSDFYPPMEIVFIVGDDEKLQQIADRHAVPFFYISTHSSNNQETLQYERRQLEIVRRYKPDYLGFAKYARVLSANFLQKIHCPVLGIENLFNAKSVDELYDQAFVRGAKLVGATCHFITADLGQGSIIEQDVRRVSTAATLPEIVQLSYDVERSVFATGLQKVLWHKVITYNNRTIVFG